MNVVKLLLEAKANPNLKDKVSSLCCCSLSKDLTNTRLDNHVEEKHLKGADSMAVSGLGLEKPLVNWSQEPITGRSIQLA